MKKIDIKTYKKIHRWLKINYGKACKCENPDCKHKSKRFEWSLKKGKEYEYERNNFWQLCRGCHTLYDESDERKRKIGKWISENRKGENNPNYGKKLWPNGRAYSEETRKRMSIAKIGNKNRIGKYHSEESKKKMSLVPRKKHNEETKKQISESCKKIKRVIVKCPYCGLEGRGPAMSRWHFNNCKNNRHTHASYVLDKGLDNS